MPIPARNPASVGASPCSWPGYDSIRGGHFLLTESDNKMLAQIFARYHVEKIEPTEAFVAQACFDIGYLTGLVNKLEDELASIRRIS